MSCQWVDDDLSMSYKKVGCLWVVDELWMICQCAVDDAFSISQWVGNELMISCWQ